LGGELIVSVRVQDRVRVRASIRVRVRLVSWVVNFSTSAH